MVTVDERDVIVVRQILGDYGKHSIWGTGYKEMIQETCMTPDDTRRNSYLQRRLQETIPGLEG